LDRRPIDAGAHVHTGIQNRQRASLQGLQEQQLKAKGSRIPQPVPASQIVCK
jgi:hypothetical protein